MSARTFFDTNVVVYSLNSTDSRKAAVAKARLRAAVETRTGVLSYQVIQELLNIGFRKFVPPLTTAEAGLYLDESRWSSR